MLVYILNPFFFFFFFFFFFSSLFNIIYLAHSQDCCSSTYHYHCIPYIAQASIHYSYILRDIHPAINLTAVSKMRLNESLVFGLVSLLCTIDATKSPSKPALAKRQEPVTGISGPCTAICQKVSSMGLGTASECDVYCTDDGEDDDDYATTYSPTSTVTSTVTTTTKAILDQRTVSTDTNSPCQPTCSMDLDKGDLDCDFSRDFSAPVLEPHPPQRTTEAAFNRRTVTSVVQGDCTAVCWDLMPGTECDVQCSSAVETTMPGNITHSSGTNSFHLPALIVQVPTLSILIFSHTSHDIC